MSDKTLTCVYCGQAYPKGTPPHGSKILTDHIKVCEKHPMRDAEAKITKLRSALVALVGAESKEELENMKRQSFVIHMPESERRIAIDTIQALIDTM